MSISATDVQSSPPGSSAGPRTDVPELVIKPSRGWIGVDWHEIISHRELLVFMIWRDVKVKYKQAILGVAWAIFVPLISVTLFTFIGKAAGFDSKVNGSITLHDGTTHRGSVVQTHEGWMVHSADTINYLIPLRDVKSKTDTTVTRNDGKVYVGTVTKQEEIWTVTEKPGVPPLVVSPAQIATTHLIPYAIFVYAGMLPWLFMQASIVSGGMSLVSQQNLLSKIYMPRLLMPAASVGSALIDMGLSAIVFVGMMVVYRFMPSANLWALIPLMLLAIVGGLGIAFLLSALTVNFRDMRFLIPFLSQILMWLSGAMYPPKIFGEHENWLAINPIYGIISAFRSAILGDPWNWTAIGVAIGECMFLFVFGLFYFKRAERRFADIA